MEDTGRRFQFDFGPISRTLGEGGNHLGFASLPVHEAVVALIAARDREEFVSWLWHDSFKGLFSFQVNSKGELQWHHTPGGNPQHYLASAFNRFANAAQVNPKLAAGHHQGSMMREDRTITSEFGATWLGESAHFVQLSLACQPAAHTVPLRHSLTEAFLRAVSEHVAKGLASLSLPFHRVRYSFYPISPNAKIGDIANQYSLDEENGTLCIDHWVPSDVFDTVELHLDLTDWAPRRQTSHEIALIELLTVYRDDLTTVAAIPLFMGDIGAVAQQIRATMRILLPEIVAEAGISATHRHSSTGSLLDVVQDEMVEIRAIDERSNVVYRVVWQGKPRQRKAKPIHALIQRPYELMADDARSDVCRVCGTPISSEAAACCYGSHRLSNVFSGNFVDYEYAGFTGAICPLCLIYANSANTTLLRGAVAFLAPSTSLSAPLGSRLTEQPRFDMAGRFDPAKILPKSAITLQEMVLLTMMSRRVVDALIPFEVECSGRVVERVTADSRQIGVYLPYAGAYLVFDPSAVRSLYRDVLLRDDPTAPSLWQTADLEAYPFSLDVPASFSLLLSLRANAAHFKGRHTLLKSTPAQVSLSPNAVFNVLVDDGVQETVDYGLVEGLSLIRELAGMRGLNRREFIKALLSGHDPVESAYLAANRPRDEKGHAFRLIQAERFWNRKEVVVAGTAEEEWMRFTELTEQVRGIVQAHPTLRDLL